jgi:hypothetical protein
MVKIIDFKRRKQALEKFRDGVLEEHNKERKKKLAWKTRKKDAESHLANKVETIGAKGLVSSQWDQKYIGTLVSWFKRSGDKAHPNSTKEQLFHQHYCTCNQYERGQN